MSLRPNDVHDVQFSKPPIGKRGYDESQVDAFLERVETALLQAVEGNGSMAPEAVRDVSFGKAPRGQRGYDEAEVDAFLDLVQAELARLTDTGGVQQAGVTAEPAAPPEQAAPADGPVVADSLYDHKPWWRFGR